MLGHFFSLYSAFASGDAAYPLNIYHVICVVEAGCLYFLEENVNFKKIQYSLCFAAAATLMIGCGDDETPATPTGPTCMANEVKATLAGTEGCFRDCTDNARLCSGVMAGSTCTDVPMTGKKACLPGSVTPGNCAANQRVQNGMCEPCPAGETNAAGDNPANGDTTCDPPAGNLCAVNERVQSGACVPCPAGQTRPAGDDPTAGADTMCAPTGGGDLCEENERVEAGTCVPCLGNETNEAGDNPTGADTTCDAEPTTCAANERVQNMMCVDCPAGQTNAAGDNPAGADTTCDATPAACLMDQRVQNGVCVDCPAGQTRPAGDDPTAGDTMCMATAPTPCLANQRVQNGVCVDCPAGETRPAGDDPTAGDTMCMPRVVNPVGAACTPGMLGNGVVAPDAGMTCNMGFGCYPESIQISSGPFDTGYDGGACTIECTDTTPTDGMPGPACPMNSACVPTGLSSPGMDMDDPADDINFSICLESCTVDTDCSYADQTCETFRGSTQTVCVTADPPDTSLIGTTCPMNTCGGNLECWPESFNNGDLQTGFPGGYCTLQCADDPTICPTGTVCNPTGIVSTGPDMMGGTADDEPFNICVKSCSMPSDCGANEACTTFRSGTQTVCLPVSQGSGTGAACTQNSDCGGISPVCDLRKPGGECTAACTQDTDCSAQPGKKAYCGTDQLCKVECTDAAGAPVPTDCRTTEGFVCAPGQCQRADLPA